MSFTYFFSNLGLEYAGLEFEPIPAVSFFIVSCIV